MLEVEPTCQRSRTTTEGGQNLMSNNCRDCLLCLQPAVPGSASPWSSVGEQATVLHTGAVLAGVSFVGQHTSEHS